MNSKAQVVITVMIYALALLNVAAGVPKILQMPQELTFLHGIGLTPTGVLVLGVLQVGGGLLLFWNRSRLPGAIVVCIALLVSSVAIFVSGNTTFALISLIPAAASVVVICVLLTKLKRSDT